MSIFLSLFSGIGYNIRYKGMNEYVSCYRMYGDFEPWWFIEGWEEDIVASRKFDSVL